MTESVVTLRTIKHVANTMKALENLNCLTREVFSGIMTSVVCRPVNSFTSNWIALEFLFLSGVAALHNITQRPYNWTQLDRWVVMPEYLHSYHSRVSMSRIFVQRKFLLNCIYK